MVRSSGVEAFEIIYTLVLPKRNTYTNNIQVLLKLNLKKYIFKIKTGKKYIRVLLLVLFIYYLFT